jgi:hypothetical protein
MPMRARTGAGFGVQQKYRHVDVAVLGPDELMRAADKRQFLLADAVHGGLVPFERNPFRGYDTPQRIPGGFVIPWGLISSAMGADMGSMNSTAIASVT